MGVIPILNKKKKGSDSGSKKSPRSFKSNVPNVEFIEPAASGINLHLNAYDFC
jgi:hypothetical protein